MQIAQQMEADALLGRSILTLLDTSLLLLAMSVRSFSLTRLVFRIWCLKTVFQILSYLSITLVSSSALLSEADLDDDDDLIFGRSRSFGRSNHGPPLHSSSLSTSTTTAAAAAAAAAAATIAPLAGLSANSDAQWTSCLTDLPGWVWQEGSSLMPWLRIEILLRVLQGMALLVLLRDVKGYSRSSLLLLVCCCCWSWSYPEDAYQQKRARWK